MNKLKEMWLEINPKKRRYITAASVVTVVIIILFTALSGKIEQKKKRIQAAAEKAQTATADEVFDSDMLERDLYDRLQAELEQKSVELEKSNRSLKKAAEQMNAMSRKIDELLKTRNLMIAPRESEVDVEKNNPLPEGLTVPPPPPPPPAEQIRSSDINKGEYVFSTANNNNANQEEFDEIIGGIGHEELDIKDQIEPEPQKKNTFLLSTSFMEADLLTGMDAIVSSDAMDNPKPALLRIAAPAVLPNSVKANLSGCFIIASGTGSLATERIDMQLVRLSCISHNGQGVIDERIKGMVVDGTDGKVGLNARVYMHAGKHLKREAVLGVLEGLTSILQANSTIVSTSPLGTTSTIDPDRVGEVGLANGTQRVTASLGEFYKMLAKLTLPALEVGPKKNVTVVLQEPVELHVKNICEDCYYDE